MLLEKGDIVLLEPALFEVVSVLSKEGNSDTTSQSYACIKKKDPRTGDLCGRERTVAVSGLCTLGELDSYIGKLKACRDRWKEGIAFVQFRTVLEEFFGYVTPVDSPAATAQRDGWECEVGNTSSSPRFAVRWCESSRRLEFVMPEGGRFHFEDTVSTVSDLRRVLEEYVNTFIK